MGLIGRISTVIGNGEGGGDPRIEEIFALLDHVLGGSPMLVVDSRG